MPLVRLELKNEYALGLPDLYKEANAEDPRTVLEGVTVAGLVGVLRQLGDLAEFAAEVFHSLQEQVAATTSRSHQLINRLKKLELALPPLEKAVLGQRSHLHFAYTSGSTWRAHVAFEKGHFLYSDMPKSIMDSYEDCRGPPNLHLLDRFDPGGRGSCMKRYSDPLIFKRVSATSEETSTSKVVKDKMDRKIKRRRPRPRSEVPKFAFVSSDSGRMRFPQDIIERHTPPYPAASSWDASSLSSSTAQHSKLGVDDGSCSFRGNFRPDHSESPKGRYFGEQVFSPVNASDAGFIDFNPAEEKVPVPLERVDSCSTSERWNEKAGPLDTRLQESETYGPTLDHGNDGQSLCQGTGVEKDGDCIFDPQTLQKIDGQPASEGQFHETVSIQAVDETHSHPSDETMQHLDAHLHAENNESESDLFLDALNATEFEIEPELELEKAKETENHLEAKQTDEVQKLDLECSSKSGTPAHSHEVTEKGDVPYQSPSVHESSDSSEVTPKDILNSTDKTLQSSEMDSLACHKNETVGCGNTLKPVESTADSISRDDSLEMLLNHGTSSPKSQESSADNLAGNSVTFWTNGSLLGLQPSKPPDFKRPTAEAPFGHGKGEEVTPLVNHPSHRDAVNTVQEKPRNVDDDIDIDASRWRTAWKISPSDLDVKTDSRLLSFGSTKKIFPGEKENGPGDYQGAGFSEHKNHLDDAPRQFSLQPESGGESSLISPSSSPPLQHMKISFQPMDEFAASKLKLKFQNTSTDGQPGCDYFPSFQLVPKLLDKQDNSGSVSDADTFDGSSRSLSEDCHSDQNDFVSDCESNDSSTGKEHDLYSSLQKQSLTGSVSTAPGPRSDHLDIECWKNLDTLGSAPRSEPRTKTTSKEPVHPEVGSTPAPPQSQWQSIRPLIHALEEKCRLFSDPSHSTSAVLASTPAPSNKDLADITNSKTSKRSYSQKPEPDRDACHEKSTPRNDFLHQIRTKSCNLRQTVKPAEEASGAPVQVSLLLKKARAIREAVGSDGDDDGSWSETS